MTSIPSVYCGGPGIPTIELVHYTIQDGPYGIASVRRRGLLQSKVFLYANERRERIWHIQGKIQRDWNKIIIETWFLTYGCALLLCLAQHITCQQGPDTAPNSSGLPSPTNG